MPPSTPKSAKLSSNQTSLSVAPFLRFYHAESLRTKTLALLTILEQAQDSTPHRTALADLVLELTDTGLVYYFIRPLKWALSLSNPLTSASVGSSGL